VRPNPAGSHPDIGAFENPRGAPALVAGDHVPIPSEFAFSVFPNPFNPQTVIRFALPHAGRVTLRVFDITGRFVKTLTDQSLDAGEHSVFFDGGAMPSGVYFVRIETATVSQTRKLVLLK
jgi:hypothetical protein